MKRDARQPEERRLAAAIRPLAAAARRELGSHPATDDLVAYHRREMEEDAAEALRDHLARCSDCARRGFDLAAFVEPRHLDPETAPEEEEAGWRALEQEIRGGREPVPSTPAGPAGFLDTLAAPLVELARLFGSLRFAYGLAALFLMTTLALPWLLAGRGTAGPEASPLLVDLFPIATTQRGPATAEIRRIPAASGYVVLSLAASPGDLPQDARYRAEIFELEGASPKRWRLEVEPTAEGFFTVGLPGGALAAGRYGIEISTAGDLVAEYRFKIGGWR